MTTQHDSASRPAGSSYAWWVVVMLWVVCFFNYADRQAISSVLPILGKEYQFDKTQQGLIGSAFMWVYAFGAPLAGLAADRVARKNLILGGCVLWSFFTMATAWCSRLPGFIAVRALTGLGETFYFPSAMSMLSDYHSQRTRSRAMAWHQSAVYAGTILGSWLAAVLAERHGWRVPFYFFGPIGIVLAFVLWRYLREPQREVSTAVGGAETQSAKLTIGETLTAIIQNPVAPLLMAAFLCANFVATILMIWTPTFLYEKFQYSLGAAGLNGTVYIHLGSALAVPIAGTLADHWTKRFAAGRMAVQLAGLLLGATFVFLMGTASERAYLLAAMAGLGICKGFYDSGIFASLYDAIEPRARGAAAGLMNTIGWGGGALGPLYIGYATMHGKKATDWENMSDAIAKCGAIYLVSAGFMIAAIFLMTRQSRAARRP